MKALMYICVAALLLIEVQAQLYQGPAQGTSPAGVLVNTSNFAESAIRDPLPKRVFNKFTYTEGPVILPELEGKAAAERVYVEDASATRPLDADLSPLVLKSFNGITETNSIPPDPYIAVGPNHILTQVNTSFAISDKNGNRLKTITADTWYASALSVAGPFDPKVIYDHYANRWVMVWLDQDNATQRGNLLISVSDDENPLGAWYNWAVPSGVNGSTAANNWSDYQGVGYDRNAIYITSNQFDFNTAGSTFQYSKVRIIPKTGLYANTGAPFTFFDIWDIRNPLSTGSRIFSLRPSRSFTDATDFYLVHLPQGSGNGVYVYKIKDAATSPSMSGFGVSIRTYSSTSTAGQLGGGSPALEAGGASLRNEPVHIGDRLHMVHAINNPTYFGYSALHYIQVNLANNTAAEDIVYGADKHYFIYPALAVDRKGNVALTYSRSGDSSYAGAYFTGKLNGTTTFIPSVTMQHGKANYVKTFGGTRNRWGDYNGLWLDPADSMAFWSFSEFAAATNTWGTWTSQFRLEPYDGKKLFAYSSALAFKPTKVGSVSDTIKVVLSNLGNQSLVVDSIKSDSANFVIKPLKPYPFTLNTYDSTEIAVVLKPLNNSMHNDTLRFYGNGAVLHVLPVSGKGYLAVPAATKQFYAMSGTGQLVKLNKANGAGTVVGASNYASVAGLAIHPKTKVLYGLRNNENTSSELLEFNVASGEAFALKTLPNINFTAIAFDTAGVLYAATRTGMLYTFDYNTGRATFVDTCKTYLSGMVFHPVSNILYGSVYKAVGTGRDRIVKINPLTGDTVHVGLTGFSTNITALAFDEYAGLFGTKGSSSAAGDLIKIDTATAAGTLIGSTGITGVTAMTYFSEYITSVTKDPEARAEQFGLAQNYPNPFNPETMIQYSVPVTARVVLQIYNVLGEKVYILDEGTRTAGVYSVRFDARKAGALSSGIYFYEMIAEHADGTYRQIKKLNLVK